MLQYNNNITYDRTNIQNKPTVCQVKETTTRTTLSLLTEGLPLRDFP